MEVCIWPDGIWCELRDIEGYGWKSDDYKVVAIDASDEDLLEMIIDCISKYV